MMIKRGEVSALSNTIGKCAIRSIGNELFLPMIKLKSSCTAVVEETKSLMKAALVELGLKEGDRPNDEQAKMLMLQQVNINDDELDFTETKLLTFKQFTDLHDENPSLTTSELEFLHKWLVKEEENV